MKTNPSPSPRRRMKLLAPTVAVCGALALFAGCASEDSHVVSAPPPAPATTTVTTTQSAPEVAVPATTSYTTTTTSNPNPTASTVIVTQALPAPQEEVVLARPSADYVWVPGYWTWRESRYEWMAGHWELPPYKGSSWIPPRTEPEGNAYRFYEGHWN